MTSIRIYVEGGGDSQSQKRELRQGMNALLDPFVQRVRAKKGWRWDVVMCGGRQQAYEAFKNARQRAESDEVILLLVDSEAPVTAATRVDHLRLRPGDSWDLSGVPEDHIHLMVQTMEAWLIADPDNLAKWYGKEFQRGQLPENKQLEETPKARLEPSLIAATQQTKKGAYHKIRHASELLKLIRPDVVRQRCPHAGFFFDKLNKIIG